MEHCQDNTILFEYLAWLGIRFIINHIKHTALNIYWYDLDNTILIILKSASDDCISISLLSIQVKLY